MSTKHHPDWVKEMKLSREEIATLEQYINVIEKADKHKAEFISAGGNDLKFTPVAMLLLAVVRFVYDVTRDYGGFALEQDEIPHVFKDVVRKLRQIESSSADNPSLDIYAKLRRDLADARSSAPRPAESP